MERSSEQRKGIERGAARYAAVAAIAAALAASPVSAATRAGTAIPNTATLTFTINDVSQTLPSNTVTIATAETLDVAITADRPTVAPRSSGTTAIGFVVTNSGNGQEDFALAISSASPGVAVDHLAIDSNGDGSYDPATDATLAVGAPLSLAPGATTRVFVLVDGAQVGGGTAITASVTARTGSGAAGTVFPAAGDQGSDAVVGTTGASARATTQLVSTASLPSLAKTQSVFAPDGSQRVIPGAIVTYRLVATFVGATRGVVIDDPIPPGTTYVPGTLRLDDATLSDASDGDVGSATAAAISVELGDMPGAGSRSIQFSVKIQ